MLSKLSEKCKSSADVEFCNDVYSDITNNNSNLDPAVVFIAELFFAKHQLKKDGAPSEMIRLINKYDNPDHQKDGYQAIIYHYQIEGEVDDEAKFYREFADKFKSNSDILNGYAWRMTELKLNLEDALIKSTIAAQLMSKDPQSQANILDTKAEILWLLNKHDEAIKVIDLAIDINPDSGYFREQKIKFQNSKEE
jgi:tetratricopeptide (TPR) repeat protein